MAHPRFPAVAYSMDELGSDLVALLDRLEIERASLCGALDRRHDLSSGRPPTRRSGSSEWSSAVPRLGSGRRRAGDERAATVRASGVEAVADAVLGRWFTPAFRDAHPEVIERMRGQLGRHPREGYAGCCEAIAAMDLTGELPAIAAPTLVLGGEHDPSTPPEHGRRIAELIPGARFELVSNAAHLASVERPDLTTMTILRFLSDE